MPCADRGLLVDFNLAERAVLFIVGAGGKVQDVGRAGVAAVPEPEAPQPVDLNVVAMFRLQPAATLEGAVLVRSPMASSTVRAKGRRRKDRPSTRTRALAPCSHPSGLLPPAISVHPNRRYPF